MTTLQLAHSDLPAMIEIALSSVTTANTRRAYTRALNGFAAWLGGRQIDRGAVLAWRQAQVEAGTGASSLNLALSAVKRLTKEAQANGWVQESVAQAILQIEGIPQRGTRTGLWLDIDQLRALLAAPRDSARDRALLALLAGCALRRSELAALRADQFVERDGRWLLADVTGKHHRVRTVPVPDWAAAAVSHWLLESGIRNEERIFRLSCNGIRWVVRKYATIIGVPDLAPHDLRRTCARLCREAGADLEQIQLQLGHASLVTTERYLGGRQKLGRGEAACDCLVP